MNTLNEILQPKIEDLKQDNIWLTIQQTVDQFEVSKSTLRRYIKDKKIDESAVKKEKIGEVEQYLFLKSALLTIFTLRTDYSQKPNLNSVQPSELTIVNPIQKEGLNISKVENDYGQSDNDLIEYLLEEIKDLKMGISKRDLTIAKLLEELKAIRERSDILQGQTNQLLDTMIKNQNKLLEPPKKPKLFGIF